MRFSFALALLAAAASGCSTAQTATTSTAPARPKNVILMIADGFGPAAATMGAGASERPLALNRILVGSVETSSSDSRVTDSAAGATSYSCGLKSYNGAIGVDADGAPCQTVLELAEARGMATGLVATSRITHATPASFAAHVTDRADETAIARQLGGSSVDLLFGGGLREFEGVDMEFAVATDLLPYMRQSGWTVATDRAGYDAIDGLPAAALLADNHLAYEIDRASTDQPSLAELATRALELLSTSEDGRENGFFLMIEGSRVDHAAHQNDPAGTLGDVLAYDAAVAAVLAWAEADGSTLVVSTADHETGGLTLGRDGIYAWDPAPLLAVTASFEAMIDRLGAGEDAAEVVRQSLGLDGLPDGAAEALRGAAAARDLNAFRALVRDLESEPAHIAWTTTGHTAVDVGLYAFGPGAERFRGRHVNADVGRALADLVRLGGRD